MNAHMLSLLRKQFDYFRGELHELRDWKKELPLPLVCTLGLHLGTRVLVPGCVALGPGYEGILLGPGVRRYTVRPGGTKVYC